MNIFLWFKLKVQYFILVSIKDFISNTVIIITVKMSRENGFNLLKTITWMHTIYNGGRTWLWLTKTNRAGRLHDLICRSKNAREVSDEEIDTQRCYSQDHVRPHTTRCRPPATHRRLRHPPPYLYSLLWRQQPSTGDSGV